MVAEKPCNTRSYEPVTTCKLIAGLSGVVVEDASEVVAGLVILEGLFEDWETFADSSLLRLAILGGDECLGKGKWRKVGGLDFFFILSVG